MFGARFQSPRGAFFIPGASFSINPGIIFHPLARFQSSGESFSIHRGGVFNHLGGSFSIIFGGSCFSITRRGVFHPGGSSSIIPGARFHGSRGRFSSPDVVFHRRWAPLGSIWAPFELHWAPFELHLSSGGPHLSSIGLHLSFKRAPGMKNDSPG